MIKKPRVVKNGCFWIVLKFGHPVYDWSYDRCHTTWYEAFQYALLVKEKEKKLKDVSSNSISDV